MNSVRGRLTNDFRQLSVFVCQFNLDTSNIFLGLRDLDFTMELKTRNSFVTGMQSVVEARGIIGLKCATKEDCGPAQCCCINE